MQVALEPQTPVKSRAHWSRMTRAMRGRRGATAARQAHTPITTPVSQLEELARDAVERERQRLARELHDTVSQQLFSASLLGEALLKTWATDPAKGAQYLHDLRLVTQGALAEMRALLVELRPAALTATPLAELLEQLAAAMRGRICVPVTLVTEGHAQLPGEVQVAVYRVAQEALNNIAKHADAGRVELILRLSSEGVELVVWDDGRGFDPASVPANHFGLAIMEERLAAVGGMLEVSSRRSGGTRVVARWNNYAAASCCLEGPAVG